MKGNKELERLLADAEQPKDMTEQEKKEFKAELMRGNDANQSTDSIEEEDQPELYTAYTNHKYYKECFKPQVLDALHGLSCDTKDKKIASELGEIKETLSENSVKILNDGQREDKSLEKLLPKLNESAKKYLEDQIENNKTIKDNGLVKFFKALVGCLAKAIKPFMTKNYKAKYDKRVNSYFFNSPTQRKVMKMRDDFEAKSAKAI